MGIARVAWGVAFSGSVISLAVGQYDLYPCERILRAEAPRYIELADVDGDADLDALVSGVGLSLYTWGPEGYDLFQKVDDDKVDHSRLVDVDADGDLDALSVAYNDDALQVRLGEAGGALGVTASIPTASGPVFVEVADVDADGMLDALVSANKSDQVAVYRGDGFGGFVELASFDVADSPDRLHAADLDGDGTQDLILEHNSPWIWSLTNDGSGQLTVASERETYTGVTDMAVDDLDGDGRLDVLVVSCWGNLERSEVRADGRLQPFEFNFLGNCTEEWGDLPWPAVTTGDWNLDGHGDVAITHLGDDLQLLLGDGQGGLAPWSDLDLLLSGVTLYYETDAWRVEAGDIDLDGRPELLLVNPGHDATLVRLDSAGVAGVMRVRDGVQATRTRAGDMDADGLIDMVLAGEDGISVALGDGRGGLAPGAELTKHFSAHLALGDLDGDAVLDVVSTRHVSGSVALTSFLNLGGLAFTEAYVGDLASSVVDLELGDVDNDGTLDVILASAPGVLVFQGLGDGSFQAGPSTPISEGANAICVADFDEDGQVDLVSVESNQGSAHLRFGDGAGGFEAGPSYGMVAYPDDVEAGDADGDGHVDLVANGWSGAFVMRRGAGDGTLGELISTYVGDYTQDVVLADHDGDGDLAVFTTSWSEYLTLSDWEDGAFQPTRRFAGAECREHFTLADLDGQGALEIVLPRLDGQALTVLRGGP